MIEELYKKFLASSGVCTDSRELKQNSIFFALKGENFDGNKYAISALENGCKYSVIDNKEFNVNENCILVDDVLETLQKLANYHRKQLNIPIIAITGSNGKTTTKELIKAVLETKFKLVATIGNLNNHIGVPLTILSMNKETELGIVEMGANHPSEIKILAEIAEPDFGLITNIGKAHIEGFGSFQGVINTKKELYDNLEKNNKTVFIRFDNEILQNISPKCKLVKYGEKSDFFVCGTSNEANPMLKVKWISNNSDEQTIQTNLIGTYNYENVLAAISIGLFFEISKEEIKNAIETYYPTNNRSQIKETGKNTLIMDAYNANPTSMTAAIENLKQIKHKNISIILGDMLELGNISEIEHKSIIKLLTESGFKKVYLIGKMLNSANENSSFKSFLNTDDFISWLVNNKIENSLILIKGSRGNRLEKVVEYL
jgi:UDP-N-acetylmuramoyl-tripeptide--D-alanyl-D-alanine ligase